MSTLDVQRKLAAAGFDPGPLDGAWGPRTRSAVVAFQRHKGLRPDGAPGPKTLAALNAAGSSTAGKGEPLASTEPIWVSEGRRKLGLHEKADNAELRAFLKSDGRTLGDPIRLPWCGDFVETCLRLALPDEPLPANPYLARNWLAFGTSVHDPVVGAIAVFWRGSRSGHAGHVGFVVGAEARYLSILGGNQANSISVSRLDRARLLGLRWPKTAGPAALAPPPPATGVITTNEA